ncbi:MAG: tetratricopeptide repeat protein [Hydrogenothermaceae bacterium]|nr:tetratricopeptide repeat protein [Hydrogenothermaceae bacterium]
MEKEKLPIEKDVDLELEYKLYSVYDFLKKRWKLVISLLFIVLVGAAGFYLKEKLDKEKREKASILLSKIKINSQLSENKIEEAKKLIIDFEKNYSSTDLYKVVLAYKILIEKESNKEDQKSAKELLGLLKTDLKSGVNEYIAYTDYKENKLKEAKLVLESIDQKNYNFYSSRALLGFIYKKEGNTQKAQEMFKLLSNSNYRYFSLIGKENL